LAAFERNISGDAASAWAVAPLRLVRAIEEDLALRSG
jgi:hypothetical protein